uniref:Uncharacterized protein LOC111103511 isoform X2 n=1 Tax=Crassostrea virginica TaxID=6565 RepID=A0A8B8ANB0_CRAVI|nr:uncharacterized protein LOC111103511 isoform X2 [Crassostrea virginica]
MRLWICWATLTMLCENLGATTCKPDVDDQCCSGYKWNNSSGRCETCPSGYNGPQCAYPCPHPYYGENCLYKCNCTEEHCDFVFGCKPTSIANKDTVQTIEKSGQIGAKNFSEEGQTEGTTDVSPSSPISMSWVSMVFYITIALISVCVVFLLIYGASYFQKKFFLRKQTINSTLNVRVEESVYSHYEEVNLTHI